MIITHCAKCGAKDSAMTGLGVSIEHEFCGKCNAEYLADLDFIHPDALQEGRRLAMEAALYHLTVGYGESDELCCRKCVTYTRWLSSVKNFTGDVPSAVFHPEPPWVLAERQVIARCDRGGIALDENGRERLENMRRNLAYFEASRRSA